MYQNELRLYKNFCQPVIKLVKKERIGGKIYRRYDTPKTPYQRAIESNEISKEIKQKLTQIYNSLNPAELKRKIDEKLNMLYLVYQEKKKKQGYDNKYTALNASLKKTRLKTNNKNKKLKPNSLTFNLTQPSKFHLHN